jgi:hypothetical protein
MEVKLHSLLISPLNIGDWSASRSVRFILSKRDPGTHWREGWVGPSTGLNAVAKRNISVPALNRTPVTQHVASQFTELFCPNRRHITQRKLFVTCNRVVGICMRVHF